MKNFPVALILLLLLASPAFAQIVDTDGDGVEDSADLCPNEDASGFDANGDGCIDDPVSARHIEYWAAEDLPLSYVIHEAGSPSVGDGSDFAAIDSSFEAWTSLPRLALTAVNAGTTPDATSDGMDGVHQITFQDTGFNFGSSVLAVGLTTSFTEATNFLGRDVRPGQIVDADMLFNPDREFRTSTAGLPTAPDIQSTATHEVGHLFGLAHSAVETATMFYVLPPGENARTLESDDLLAMFKAYPDPTELAAATRLTGSVTSLNLDPVPGAAVFLINAATGDTTACEYTLPDGSFAFVGADPGDYTVAIHPLDGSSSIRFLVPDFINSLVQETAEVVFVPESWNAGDSSTDDPQLADVISLGPVQPVTGIDIVTNLDQLPPLVQEQVPASGASGVGIDAAILISFDEAIDDGTLQGNFALRDDSGNFVPGLASVFNDDRVLSFTPNAALAFGQDYTLTLGSGLADRFGNPLGGDQVSTFSTEAQPVVSITSLIPNRGVAGTSVVINGAGFDGDTVGNNTVFFDGIPATITAVGTKRIVATVPSSVAVGSFQITVNTNGNTSNDLSFSVLSLQEIARGTDVGVANLPGSPSSLATKQDGSLAYVGTTAGVSTVVVDPGQQSYLTTDPVPQLVDAIVGVDITPDGRRVYALSRVESRIHWIDSDATSANFNEVLDVLDLTGEPLDIAIEPAGRRAFVSMADGTLQIWDVEFDSATFNRQIGELDAMDAGAVGPLAFDPSGELLLFATGEGSLAMHSLRTLERVAEVAVGIDPYQVQVDPNGSLAYVTDRDGVVSVVSLGDVATAAANGQPAAVPPFKVQDIELGGSAGGVAITPAALFAYVTNRAFDQVEVIDLDPTSSTFRTSAAEIPTGSNPVATSISLDANYLFTLVEGANQMQVTAIGFGPVLRSVYPLIVRPGDYVAISGFGFSPVDCQTMVCPPGNGDRIWFGDFEATEFEPVGDSYLNVRVPLEFEGGPVRVQVINGGPPSAPDPFSNSIFVRTIEPGGAFDFASNEGFNRSVFMDSSTGYDFFDAQDQALTNVASVSPNGEIVVLGGFGTLWLLDGRTSSGTYNQILAEVTLSIDERVQDVTFSPDGKVLYVSLSPSFGDSVIDIVDVNPNSPSFGTVPGQVDLSNITNCFSASALSMHPTGQFLFITDQCNDAIVVADITPGSINENTIIERPAFFGFTYAAAFHPGGSHLYTAHSQGVYIVNSNPLSAGWPEWETFVNIDTLYGMSAQAVAFTPDGNRGLVLTTAPNVNGGAFVDYYILTLDTTNVRNPSVLYPPQLVFEQAELVGPGSGSIEVAPAGHRAIFHIARHGAFMADIAGPAYTVVGSTGITEGNAVAGAGLAFTPDGERAYLVERQSSNVGSTYAQLLNFLNFAEFNQVTGNLQTGIVGQPLPAPLRLTVTGSGTSSGLPLAGVAVEVNVTGGGSLPNGGSSQIFSTNENGIIEVNWTLGPVADPPGTEFFDAANQMTLFLGQVSDTAPLEFSALAVEDPATLPLNFVQVLPANAATGVSATSSVQAIFSRAIDPASANVTAFFLHPSAEVDPVPAIIGLADGARRVSLTPIFPLDFDTVYEVEITSNLADLDANVLTNPTVTTFTTASPPPLRLSSVSPPSSAAGIELVLGGQGFNLDPALNTVFFNDVPATPTDSGLDFLRVTVPGSAVTGDLRVEANGEVSSTLPFTVLVPNTAPLDEVIASVGGGSTTKGVALTPDGTRAYTISPEANSIIPIDVTTFATLPGIEVGNNPVSIDLHPNGKLAYVANFGSNDISVIDIDPASPDFNTVIKTIPTGNSPIDLAVSPQGDGVFVAHAAETFFNVIDADANSSTFNSVVASVGTGSTTKAVVVDPDGSRVFFGTSVGYFIVAEPAFDTVVASVGSGSATRAVKITADGGLLIVLNAAGAVDIYDVNETSSAFNQVVASVGGGSSTRAVNLSPDGGLLYLFQEGSDEILVYSLEILGGVSAIDEVVTPPARVSLNLLKTLDLGPDPTAMGFDPSGSGLAILATAGDQQLLLLNTGNVPLDAVVATIHVTPRTLNLSSNGRYVTGSIELPLGLFPQQIDVSTVLLYSDNAEVGVFAEPSKVSIEDGDNDGIDELVVKFARDDFQRIIPEGDAVPVFIQGMLDDGRSFLGEDAIRTHRPSVTRPMAGEEIHPGSKVQVAWDSPDGVSVDAASIYYSVDDGETWAPIAEDIWDGGSVQWFVPSVSTTQARVLVVLKKNGLEVGSGISPEPFSILTKPVAVALQSLDLTVERGNAQISWRAYGPPELLGFHVLRSEEKDSDYEKITEHPVAVGVEGFSFEDEEILGNRTYYYMLEEAWSSGDGYRHGPYELMHEVKNSLGQNFPNSFNPKTSIRFSIARRGPVRLVLYNVAGQRVKVLVDETLEADEYQVEWSGRDSNGKEVSSGVYLYRLETDGFVASRKMTLVR